MRARTRFLALARLPKILWFQELILAKKRSLPKINELLGDFQLLTKKVENFGCSNQTSLHRKGKGPETLGLYNQTKIGA